MLCTGYWSLGKSQDRPAAQPRTRLLFTLECLKTAGWKAVDAQTVFKTNDKLRFRLRTSLTGYLYILNHSSSGKVAWVYPASDKSSNHIVANTETLIPGAEGSFVINGAPGIDTLYWILRNEAFTVPNVEDKQLDVPSTLLSRCSEENSAEIDHPQMACLDGNAGVKPLADPDKLRGALGMPNSLVARDLTFEAKPGGTEIRTESDGASSGIVYQVRIAHN